VGLATTADLLSRGADVTCFEAVAPMSQRSSGESRIFRLAHAQPELVELAALALVRFREWESASGAELVNRVGALICGGDVEQWAASMAAAGAKHEVVDAADVVRDLPVHALEGPTLVDPTGGVINARLTGEALVRQIGAALIREDVRALEQTSGGVRVMSERGWQSFECGVIAAGARSTELARQVGIDVPPPAAHHVRFTFALRDADARPPCLIDRTEAWQSGFTTYQHLTEPGRWAVGGHLPAELCSWERGRDAVVNDSRRLVSDYVRECARGLADEPLDELYCDIGDSWDDGYTVKRHGGFLALYGDNLFKLAPAIGGILGDAAMTGSTPLSMGGPDQG
jgi:sarcosine oxidase